MHVPKIRPLGQHSAPFIKKAKKTKKLTICKVNSAPFRTFFYKIWKNFTTDFLENKNYLFAPFELPDRKSARCSLPAGPVRQGTEGGPVQEPPAQGQVGMGGGEARSEQLTPESSVDSWNWKEGRAGVIQTKWRTSVVGERFYEAILASPHP